MAYGDRPIIRRLATLAFVVALSSLAAAQQKPAVSGEPAPPAGQAEAGEEQFLNELALVVAGTRERAEDEKETSFTIGVEYERKLSERFGVAGEAEFVNGPDTWVFALPFVFRPAGEFKLFTGPGFERSRPQDEEETHAGEPASVDDERKSRFLWRVGAGYNWEFKERYVVGPSFYLDVVHEGDGEWKPAFVFALSLGIAF